MKKTFLFLAFLMVAGFIFTGCKKDDDAQESYLLVEGNRYILTGGDLFFEGSNGMEADLYNFSISLISEGLVFNSWNSPNPSYSGNGLLTLFSLRTTCEANPCDGDYPLGLATGVRCMGGGYELDFSSSWTAVNEFDTGTLTIHVDGEKYTIEYIGDDEYGNAVELFYTGVLTYHNESTY
jgi:hypothetical protein